RSGERRLLFEDVLLHRVPARPAELDGPRRSAPSARAEDFLPADVVGALQMPPAQDLLPNLRGQLCAQEFANFRAKRLLLRREIQVQRAPPLLPMPALGLAISRPLFCIAEWRGTIRHLRPCSSSILWVVVPLCGM